MQKYITQAPLNVLQTYNQLQAGKSKSKGFYEFDIMERGKQRHIRSVVIGERVVQRCLCDYALVPVLTRTFVYRVSITPTACGIAGKGFQLCGYAKESQEVLMK